MTVMDMWFTKKEAQAKLKSSIKNFNKEWKWQGIAKDRKYKRKAFVTWRTNSQTSLKKLKKDKRYKIIKIHKR